MTMWCGWVTPIRAYIGRDILVECRFNRRWWAGQEPINMDDEWWLWRYIWRLWNIMDVDGELPYPYLMYATGTSVPNLPYMSAGVADLILFIHIYPYLSIFNILWRNGFWMWPFCAAAISCSRLGRRCSSGALVNSWPWISWGSSELQRDTVTRTRFRNIFLLTSTSTSTYTYT